MMSNRSRRSWGKPSIQFGKSVLPVPPGPPGLNINEPSRWAGSPAGCLTTASEIVRPCGSDQSSGTVAVAHSNPVIFTAGFGLAGQAAQSSGAPAV